MIYGPGTKDRPRLSVKRGSGIRRCSYDVQPTGARLTNGVAIG